MTMVYYPLVEQAEYATLDALCKATGIARSELDFYVTNAQIESSELIVCDRITLEILQTKFVLLSE